MATAIPPTIPGSLDVDTINVNKYLNAVDQIVGDALSTLNTWKGAVDAATTANITLSGTQTVDGVTLVVGDKVLVKDQSTASENGLYIVQAEAWYRSEDLVTGTPAAGTAVFVKDGTANNDQIFVNTNAAGSDVTGTNNLVFSTLTATMSAPGSDAQVIYNNGGVLGGATGFTFNDGTSLVSLPGDLEYSTATGGVNATMTNVSQLTSITTGVTANGRHGRITTQAATAGAAGATPNTFTVTNSEVAATDIVHVTLLDYAGTIATNGNPFIQVDNIGAGTFDIIVSNAHSANALNGALVIGYTVIKAA